MTRVYEATVGETHTVVFTVQDNNGEGLTPDPTVTIKARKPDGTQVTLTPVPGIEPDTWQAALPLTMVGRWVAECVATSNVGLVGIGKVHFAVSRRHTT